LPATDEHNSIDEYRAHKVTQFLNEFDYGKVIPVIKNTRFVGGRRFLSHEKANLEYKLGVVEAVKQSLVKMGLKKESEVWVSINAIIDSNATCKKALAHLKPDEIITKNAVLMKKMDGLVPGLNGMYTWWNKLSLKPGVGKDVVVAKRLKSWLFSENKRSDHYMERIDKYMDVVMGEAQGGLATLTYDEFVLSRNLWATGGSTDYKERIRDGLPANKLGLAYSLSDSDLLKLANSMPDKIELDYIIKEEPGTVRAVILADIHTYLRMSYICYYVDKSLKTTTTMYNYLDAGGKSEFWLKSLGFVRGGYENVDLDYSNWDEMSLELVFKAMRSISRRFPWFSKQIEECITLMKRAYIQIGDKNLHVRSGLWSGLRMTTLINSIINSSTVSLACDELEIEKSLLQVLGDDVHLVTKDGGHRVMDVLDSWGFRINRNKSHISREFGEFLKMFITKEGVKGGLYRSLRSLFWSSESERSDTTLLGKVTARTDLWVKAVSRGLDLEKAKKCMCVEFPQLGFRFKVLEWLDTMRCLGGGGLGDSRKLTYLSDSYGWLQRAPNLKIKPHSKYGSTMYNAWKQGIQLLFDKNKLKSSGIIVRGLGKQSVDIIGTSSNRLDPRNLPEFPRQSFISVPARELDDWLNVTRSLNPAELNAANRKQGTQFSNDTNIGVFQLARKATRSVWKEVKWGQGLSVPPEFTIKYGEMLGSLVGSILATSFWNYALTSKVTMSSLLNTRMWFEGLVAPNIMKP
jgi:hypothetical protein